ncbi:MAG: P-loop NTPase [Dehalococcoidales bacterium]|nr:P-loop NTPase [Dehalococcoidales bacterium]
MGLFHCPLGAAFYDDEPCIDCGMCYADTSEEMVKASEKLRTYLKATAMKKSSIKKITISGKGGVGKSTATILLTNAFLAEGYSVLVVDTDESNPGLYRMFQFDKEPRPLIKLLSRFALGEPEPDTEWITREKLTIQDIPADYILSRGNLKFLMVGKISEPFQGCACSMADITRDLMGKLVLGDKEIIIVDMEAGVESFGRGVERNADTVLMIVEPSFESMALAEKIGYMAEGMGISRVRAILNKVPTETIRQKMVEELVKKNIKIAGTVFYDPKISEAGFEGKAPGDSKAQEEIRAIVKQLLSEA